MLLLMCAKFGPTGVVCVAVQWPMLHSVLTGFTVNLTANDPILSKNCELIERQF